MVRMFEWAKVRLSSDRPITWHYWPVGIGWVRRSCHAIACWHGWPLDGSEIYPDATAKHYGWTLHLGALKVYFGQRRQRVNTHAS